MNFLSRLSVLVDRLKEPSTYAGFAPLLALFGLGADDPTVKGIFGIAVGLSAAVAMLLPEKGGK